MTAIFHPVRRRLLAGSAAAAALACLPRRLTAARHDRDPFGLGVASGYPTPDGIVLWTRLAPEPLAPGGGLGDEPVPVALEIAADDAFRDIVRTQAAWADPAYAHALHVEPVGLAPARDYWYRFRSGDAVSATGHFRTAPAPASAPERLRFALASCAHYEHGYYAAYRHMAADDLDVAVHVGDYIYEGSWGEDLVRRHEGPEPVTLNDYRARYARYRSDPDLQAAHAACPWLVIWDDHEVENDYAGARSENLDEERWFLARRAAAYRAFYEHMPLPRAMHPHGPDMRIHTRWTHGTLAEFHLLDDRQYRSPQPCPREARGGSNRIDAHCEARHDPAATLLGARQETWLAAGVGASKARWNLLAQQTLMAQSDAGEGEGLLLYSDAWDGYPAARARLFDTLVQRQVANPVVLGGDVHSFWVNDLERDFVRPESAVIATEFVTTSISSRPPPAEWIATAVKEGAHVRFASGEFRGYTRFELRAASLTADLRVLDDVRRADSGCRTHASWVVEDGRAGAQPV